MTNRTLAIIVASAMFGLIGPTKANEIAVSANDGKVRLDDGVVSNVKGGIDTVTIYDISSPTPKLIGEVKAPTTVQGPPTTVAVSPKADLAIVSGGYGLDAADHTKTILTDTVSVISLKGSPAVTATLKAGLGATGVSINKQGTLAIVANRGEGTASVFSIKDSKVEPVSKVDFGDPKIGPSGVVFSPDGKTALVTMDGETGHRIAILSVDGTKVEFTKRWLNAGLRPYAIDMATDGTLAAVANIGRGGGDDDTVSVIDMRAKPIRVVNTATVGQTPEGLKFSHDGKILAVTVMNGTNKPKSNPFFNERGKLVLYRVDGTQLVKQSEAAIGKWCQGIAWSKDGKRVFAQCMAEKEIHGFTVVRGALRPASVTKVSAGPAAIRTAE